MKIEKTFLEGCFIVKPDIFEDDRGTFFESFNQKRFEELTGLQISFVQDNQSISTKGVLRGLHFQTGEYAQAKLVRVISGEVLDIAVDLRQGSETYGKYFSMVLDDKNKHQLFIPRGFAHGFLVLSENAIFSYKCDNYYHKASESGIRYDDPYLNIDWGIKDYRIRLSEKDRILPFFDEVFTI